MALVICMSHRIDWALKDLKTAVFDRIMELYDFMLTL
jgi:hypothetical protein